MGEHLRLSVTEWNTLRRGHFEEAGRLLDRLFADHTASLRSNLSEAMTDLDLATTIIADAQARIARPGKRLEAVREILHSPGTGRLLHDRIDRMLTARLPTPVRPVRPVRDAGDEEGTGG